jgi:F0F1-type ATP synthase assembly protein I
VSANFPRAARALPAGPFSHRRVRLGISAVIGVVALWLATATALFLATRTFCHANSKPNN